jgi:Protein of unknown function (DUF3800)
MTQPPGTLALQSTSGVIVLPPTSFAIFVDETGDELMRDPSHPLFGLGGCALLTGHLHDVIDASWRTMKAENFPQQRGALHAKRMRGNAHRQLKVLSDFFEQHDFFRLAVLLTTRTRNATALAPYALVAGHFIEMVRQILPLDIVTQVAIVIEKAGRGDHLAREHFPPYDRFTIVRRSPSGRTYRREVPIRYFFLPKRAATSFLEIADFIVHAAGLHVREQLTIKRGHGNPLYSPIFQSPAPEWVRYMSIETAVVNPAK